MGLLNLKQLAPAIQESGSTLLEVELKGNLLGDSGAREVASWASSLSGLADLDLSSNAIGDEGAIALANALPLFSSLEDLDLGANTINANGASHLILAAAHAPKLVELDLAFNLVNDSVIPAVEELFSLPIRHNVRKLKLSGNLLSDEGVARLYAVANAAVEANTFVKISLKKQRLATFQKIGLNGADSASATAASSSSSSFAASSASSSSSSSSSSHSTAAAAAATAPPAAADDEPSPLRDAYKDLPVEDWSEDDVESWLSSSTALSSYTDSFMQNAIDGAILITLSEDDLIQLGVENSFHRKRLLNDLNKLRSAKQ